MFCKLKMRGGGKWGRVWDGGGREDKRKEEGKT